MWLGSGVAMVVAQAAAMIRLLAQELPYAESAALKRKKKKKNLKKDISFPAKAPTQSFNNPYYLVI